MRIDFFLLLIHYEIKFNCVNYSKIKNDIMPLKWNSNSIRKNYGFDIERIPIEENRFLAIYFVDGLTNSLLISKKYSSRLTTSGDLISGLLGALNMFIKELKDDNEDEEIQEINFKDTRILYERKGRLLVIGISKKTNLQIEREILHEILKDFYRRFEYEINNFNGFIEPSIIQYKKRLENLDLDSLIKFGNNL